MLPFEPAVATIETNELTVIGEVAISVPQLLVTT
jgi:hypothetical protein